MTEKNYKKKYLKIAIIILSILLAGSIAALSVILVRKALSDDNSSTVTVPDNLITPDEDCDTSLTPDSSKDSASSPNTEVPGENTRNTDTSATEDKKAATIKLYSKQPEENTPFKVDNMFPGDAETKYFRIQVSYHDKVTVHYKATVRPGYEKLAEVLKVRVNLLSTGETMYDGLMKDMPKSVTHKLASQTSTTNELYYEITAYLDTEVGNEYQNKDLIADFQWWVEETGNLDDAPQTGDTSNIVLLTVLALCSGSIIIFLLVSRKSKEGEEK